MLPFTSTSLGSLRALFLSFRFVSAAHEPQIEFTRKLAVHRLVRCWSKVLLTLQEIDREAVPARIRTSIRDLLAKEIDATAEEKADSDRQINALMAELAFNSSPEGELAAKKTSIKRVYAILRSLLSRDFLTLEAAPLLTEFCNLNSNRLEVIGLEDMMMMLLYDDDSDDDDDDDDDDDERMMRMMHDDDDSHYDHDDDDDDDDRLSRG
jgi:hypothetical protein